MADAGKIVITPKGAYSSTTTYEWLDEVSYDGRAYIALKTVTGVTPSDDGENWRLFLDPADVNANTLVPTFEEQSARNNIISGDNMSTLFGKVKKWFTDLKSHAFKDLVNNLTTEATGSALDASQGKVLHDKVEEINRNLSNNRTHNIPRLIPKDITSYYNDGTLWKRLNGTDGFGLFEDIFVGDYFKMSRPVSAYNQNQSYQLTGSQYVTIAGIDTMWGNGDNITMAYHHLVMVPGMGFDGTQHFGRSRMNPTSTTDGGYAGSEMYTTTIGAVATSGSTESTATINQQLYAEFGNHLKTTRELLSNSLNSSGYNRFGQASGCSNNWGWYSCQAVLMSEVEIYGSTVWSSSGYDTGNANKQLPLFVNSKQAINNRSAWYWLKSIASASCFCSCSSHGFSYYDSASDASSCVRPRFVIAA